MENAGRDNEANTEVNGEIEEVVKAAEEEMESKQDSGNDEEDRAEKNAQQHRIRKRNWSGSGRRDQEGQKRRKKQVRLRSPDSHEHTRFNMSPVCGELQPKQFRMILFPPVSFLFTLNIRAATTRKKRNRLG